MNIEHFWTTWTRTCWRPTATTPPRASRCIITAARLASEFFCSAYGKRGALHSPGIGDREFLTAGPVVVELFKQMIDTGEPPVPYEHVLEPMAILEAARIAQRTGRRVRLDEVWQR